jgi:hypothetical protein
MVRGGGCWGWSIKPYLRECDTPFNNNAAEAMSYSGKKKEDKIEKYFSLVTIQN